MWKYDKLAHKESPMNSLPYKKTKASELLQIKYIKITRDRITSSSMYKI